MNSGEQHSTSSPYPVKPDLDLLFAQMLNSSSQNNSEIIRVIAQASNIQMLMYPFPATFNLAHLKTQQTNQVHYLRIFPHVFTQLHVKSTLAATWHTKLLLKYSKLPFIADNENVLHFKTLTYSNISLLLQILLYQSDFQQPQSCNVAYAQNSSTAAYINQHLGPGYSHGQLIDFIDRLYDQYKHTKLPPFVFRHLFRCFGCHTTTIANLAFDNYMDTRNTSRAWQHAIHYFLRTHISLSESLSKSLSEMLVV